MRIDRTSLHGTTPIRAKERSRQSDKSGFADSLGESSESSGAAQGSAGSHVSGLDTLLTLQEVPDAVAGRAKARKHGERILERLEELKANLLDGRIAPRTVERLAAEVETARAQTDDERLDEILAEIELRAHVELAKLGR